MLLRSLNHARRNAIGVVMTPNSRVWVFWWGIGSAAAMVIGAFGPWGKTFLFTISGTDGSNDGWLIVVLAVLGSLLVLAKRKRRWASLLVVVTGVAAAAIAIYDRSNIGGAGNDSEFGPLLQVGWGLNLAILASISLAVQGLVGMLISPKSAPEARATRTTGVA